MPRFAANLSMMFNEVPFLDRFAAASEAGFKAVEFLSPYECAPEEVARRAKDAGLTVSLFNLPPGNWAAGERGLTGLPGREEEFRSSVEVAIRYAKVLGTKNLHAMAGVLPKDASPEECRKVLIENLKYASKRVSEEGITLFLEAINTRDIPGFLVNTQLESSQICEEVGAPNLKMQMDLYHMQIMEGDLAIKLKNYAATCGHIQIAGCPGRNEPTTGEIQYDYLFQVIDELGYTGWIGCEYRPATTTTEGLGWFRAINEGGTKGEKQ